MIKGENKIIQRKLYLDNGITPLDITTLLLMKAQVKQFKRVIVEYTLGDDEEIRLKTGTTDTIEIEITKELSAKFIEGDLDIQLVMEMTDTDFDVDGAFNDQLAWTPLVIEV